MTPHCKKTSYTTKAFAEADIIRFSKSNRDKKPKSSYRCKKCGMWHLTSQESNSEKVKIQAKIIEEQKQQITDLLNKQKSIDHAIRQEIMQSEIVKMYRDIVKKNGKEIKNLRKTISQLVGKRIIT
jgi:hypothetical protein